MIIEILSGAVRRHLTKKVGVVYDITKLKCKELKGKAKVIRLSNGVQVIMPSE